MIQPYKKEDSSNDEMKFTQKKTCRFFGLGLGKWGNSESKMDDIKGFLAIG